MRLKRVAAAGAAAGVVLSVLSVTGADAGTQWRVVWESTSGSVHEVTAGAPTNVWVYGDGDALRYDGAEWRRAPVPSGEYLEQISAVRTDNNWALTTTATTSSLHRFRNGAWEGVTAGTGFVDAVQATGRSGVWVAGREGGTRSDPASGTPFVRRYDGSAWTSVALPSDVLVKGFTGRTDDDLWAYGTASSRPVALHWDGAVWRRAAVQPTGEGSGAFGGLVSVNSKETWAVDQRYEADDTGSPVVGLSVVYRLDGSWKTVSRHDLLASDGEGGVWAGSWGGPNLGRYRAGRWTTVRLPDHQGPGQSSPGRLYPKDLALIPGTKTTVGVVRIKYTGSGDVRSGIVMN
ncbi:hypothetical protein ACIBF1_41940 [Spirillospora sp. NPDC050679]